MTNNEVNFEAEFCGYCDKSLIGTARFEGHPNCIRQAREMRSIKMAQDGIVEKQVDEVEEYLRKHPDFAVGRDGLTYNQRIAKEEAAKKDAERQKIVDRADRKREAIFLESRLKGLINQIARDEMEQREDEERSGNSE